MKKLILIIILFALSGLLFGQYNPLLHNYDVSFYKLDIEVSDTSTYIAGSVEINATVQNNYLDTLVVELTDTLTVDSVILNGLLRDFSHSSNEIHIPLSNSLPIGTDFSVSIYYHGTGVSEPGVHGWTVGILNQSGVTMTNSETYHSKMWWPCKQIIGDKADSVYVFITVDSTCKAGSIGMLSNTIDLPGAKRRYEWKTDFPVPYYMVFFTVSKYIEYSFYIKPLQNQDSILIQCFLPDSSYLTQYKVRIDTIGAVMNFFTELLGEYPFKRYGYCIVPTDYHENITMSNMSFSYSGWFYYLMIHMLSHQWFAASVTCSTWQDVWLHEGFATYIDGYVAHSYFGNEGQAISKIKQNQIRAKAEPGGSVYVPIEEIYDEDRILNGRLSYSKGATLVHMIRFEINNDSIFFKVLKNYLAQFKESSATAEDFKAVLETTSGLDFTDFFDQWYYGEGYPIFDIYWSQHEDTLTINSFQTGSTSVTTLFTTPLEFKIKYSNEDTVIKVYQTQNDQIFKVYAPETITDIEVDPNHWLLKYVREVNGTINNDFENSNIRIYPNPVYDFVNIEISNTAMLGASVEIIDIYGDIILNKSSLNESGMIDLTGYKTGVYFVKVTIDEMISVKKIIKY